MVIPTRKLWPCFRTRVCPPCKHRVRQLIAHGYADPHCDQCTGRSACGTTLEGSRLSKQQVSASKRVAVVSIAGETLYYHKQGVFSGDHQAIDIAAWGLDQFYAQQVASSLSKSLSVESTVYSGTLRDSIRRVYVDDAILIANRFDWSLVANDIRAIARESDADVVAVLMKDAFQDALAKTKYMVRGFGVTGARGGMCAAYAHLTLTLIDVKSGEPLAGANVYATDSNGKWVSGRVRIPEELCEQQLKDLTPQQLAFLKRLFYSMVSNATMQQTTDRLRPQ